MTHLYMRHLPGTTLEDLAAEYDEHLSTWGGPTRDIRVNLDVRGDEIPTMRLGSTEIPITKKGMASLATFLDIPPKFLERLDPDLQQHLVREVSTRTDNQDVTITYKEGGLHEVRRAGEVRVEPQRLVQAAMKVFPVNSPVVDHWNDQQELRVDVIFPEGYDLGVGGDVQVGDITRGGVRIGQDRKNNHAPTIQKFLWRRVCTNGMEVPDEGLKVSALGASAAEIEAQFEDEIRRAVDMLEADIHAFYDLRNQRVGNDPTGALRRLATEQGLPNRTIGNLEEMIPSLLDDESDLTMFDLVNLVTNQANDPNMVVRGSSRRNLQRAGGGMVNDHSARCTRCHSRLTRRR